VRSLKGAVFAGILAVSACNQEDRSVRAWIETRDPQGKIVSGVLVEIDGKAAGATDERGIYQVIIRRPVGFQVQLHLTEEASQRNPQRVWNGSFTVNSAGVPTETSGGRLIATMLPGDP
jgi:hypothetical protein